jgi:hypothetical protein
MGTNGSVFGTTNPDYYESNQLAIACDEALASYEVKGAAISEPRRPLREPADYSRRATLSSQRAARPVATRRLYIFS